MGGGGEGADVGYVYVYTNQDNCQVHLYLESQKPTPGTDILQNWLEWKLMETCEYVTMDPCQVDSVCGPRPDTAPDISIISSLASTQPTYPTFFSILTPENVF